MFKNLACTVKGKILKINFKNTFHEERAIKEMLINKAEEYLNSVLEDKWCIPYSRFDHSVGRCYAAIQFGLAEGRCPEKSVRLL